MSDQVSRAILDSPIRIQTAESKCGCKKCWLMTVRACVHGKLEPPKLRMRIWSSFRSSSCFDVLSSRSAILASRLEVGRNFPMIWPSALYAIMLSNTLSMASSCFWDVVFSAPAAIEMSVRKSSFRCRVSSSGLMSAKSGNNLLIAVSLSGGLFSNGFEQKETDFDRSAHVRFDEATNYATPFFGWEKFFRFDFRLFRKFVAFLISHCFPSLTSMVFDIDDENNPFDLKWE